MAPPWGEVTARSARVAIVAAGPSLRDLDLRRFREAVRGGVAVIAVKHAIEWLPVGAATIWFGLDPNVRTRPLMAAPRPGVAYYAAVPDDYGEPTAHRLVHRAPAEPGIVYLRRLTGPGPFGARYGLSDDPGAVSTGNSAWGAFGAAWLMRPRRVGLFGIDGTREPYAYGAGGPRRSLDHLPELFASALPQLDAAGVEVINGSPHSRVACFERRWPAAALAWLMEGE